VTKVEAAYDGDRKDLTANIIIENTGNIPANNVQTNMKMIVNATVIENMEGKSKFVLFPEQETSGSPIFHNVADLNLAKDQLDIHLEIKYELPIRFFIKIYTRKFRTVELFRYDHQTGRFRIISGESR
jgi:hypothetical protein